jgi:hypothetical protein
MGYPRKDFVSLQEHLLTTAASLDARHAWLCVHQSRRLHVETQTDLFLALSGQLDSRCRAGRFIPQPETAQSVFSGKIEAVI